jgi:hypothetical protein
MPFAHFYDIEADARLSIERDLRFAPVPISGGMRKALAKEQRFQNALRFKARRLYREPDIWRGYGLWVSSCPRCRHMMFFDEISPGDRITCDRCRKIYD